MFSSNEREPKTGPTQSEGCVSNLRLRALRL